MDELYIFDGNTVKCYSLPIIFFSLHLQSQEVLIFSMILKLNP